MKNANMVTLPTGGDLSFSPIAVGSQCSLLHHNCCCPFVKHDQQNECLQQRNLRKLKAQCLWLDQNYRGIIAQSSDA